MTRGGVDDGLAFVLAVPGLAPRGLYGSKGLGHLAGVVARSHERAAGHLAEAQPAGEHAKFVELLRWHVPLHRERVGRGLEILAEREVVDAVVKELGKHLQEFVAGLAEAEHQAAFGPDIGHESFGSGE